MGIFGGIGKALGAVSKVAGGAAKGLMAGREAAEAPHPMDENPRSVLPSRFGGVTAKKKLLTPRRTFGGKR